MSGLDEKGLRAAIFPNGENPLWTDMQRGAVDETISRVVRYLASATPADVGELVERLREKANKLDDMQGFSAPSGKLEREAATALERVVRERDEARADHEWMTANRNKWQNAATIARRRAESAEAKLAEALADRAAQAERMARLEEALRDIRDGRGKCKTCGTPATGGGAGFTDCDCVRPSWTPQDPADIAARALSQEGSDAL